MTFLFSIIVFTNKIICRFLLNCIKKCFFSSLTCSLRVPSVRYAFCGRKSTPLGPKHVVISTDPEKQESSMIQRCRFVNLHLIILSPVMYHCMVPTGRWGPSVGRSSLFPCFPPRAGAFLDWSLGSDPSLTAPLIWVIYRRDDPAQTQCLLGHCEAPDHWTRLQQW